MNRTRAERRAFIESKKDKIRNMLSSYYPKGSNLRSQVLSEKFIGIMSKTPVPCSCYGCGNRRNGNGYYDKTRQEILSELELEEELALLNSQLPYHYSYYDCDIDADFYYWFETDEEFAETWDEYVIS